MIARTWHGRVAVAKIEACRELATTRAIPDDWSVHASPSVHVLKRKDRDVAHFITLTSWESLDTIRASSGADGDSAKYYRADKDSRLKLEPKVMHYKVVGKAL